MFDENVSRESYYIQSPIPSNTLELAKNLGGGVFLAVYLKLMDKDSYHDITGPIGWYKNYSKRF